MKPVTEQWRCIAEWSGSGGKYPPVSGFADTFTDNQRFSPLLLNPNSLNGRDLGDGGRGGIRTHGWFNPTFDFESSALNRAQPPFLLMLNDLRSATPCPREFSRQIPRKKEMVWTLCRHKNSRYYARTFTSGKEKWTSRQTSLLAFSNKPSGSRAFSNFSGSANGTR